jgi:hypothetical protein
MEMGSAVFALVETVHLIGTVQKIPSKTEQCDSESGSCIPKTGQKCSVFGNFGL